ncbi:MAG: hypothetical protein M1825_000757 [Sarcosagium campestre]|nr:MAG: hypothetical protein M1825_000757 [Sarcosagium campestre]
MAPSSDWVDEYNPFSTTTSEQISHLDPAPLTDTFSLCDEDEDLIQSLLPRPLNPENPFSGLKGSSSPQDKQINDWLRDAEAQDVLWQNYPHPKELEICEPDCPDSIREIVVQSLKSRHAAPAAELLPTLPELVSPINSELATEDDVRYSAKIAIQVNGDDELSAYRNEENTRIETAASSARSSRSSLNINVGSSSKRRPSAQSETSHFSASSNGTCSTKSSRLAMSPLGQVPLEGRYAPPRLESPYGLKIKKFFKDRKGEG